MKNGKLKATTVAEPADAFLIAVPTPFKTFSYDPDLNFVRAACDLIAPVLKSGDLVILESTSPVGTTELVSKWLSSSRKDLRFPNPGMQNPDIHIAYCPERVLPGNITRELIENDRVIGGLTQKCSELSVNLYKTFVQGDCIVASHPRVAEMAKLTENSFRDVNIAFANELSIICDKIDINVWELIKLSNRHPRVNILQPGPGVGGHCIAVDPWFIVAKNPEESKLIRTAREVNDSKPNWVLDQIRNSIATYLKKYPSKTKSEIRLACYGLTFKPDIDDLRESPAIEVVKKVSELEIGELMIVEPHITVYPNNIPGRLVHYEYAAAKANIHVLLVDHSDFKRLQKPDGLIIDTEGFGFSSAIETHLELFAYVRMHFINVKILNKNQCA